MNVHINKESANEKTGPIPVSTTASYSCPTACPLKDAGCYARFGPLGLHWGAVSRGERGMTWQSFCYTIADLPDGQLWRHNQAGDLPGYGNEIDGTLLDQLVKANTGKRGFTYTHKPVLPGSSEFAESNQLAIKNANRGGFTVNLSAETLEQVDQYKALIIAPVVVVMPRSSAPVTFTPAGHKVVICPAQQRDGVTCASCGLCQKVDRSVVVGFIAHGTGLKKAESLCGGGTK